MNNCVVLSKPLMLASSLLYLIFAFSLNLDLEAKDLTFSIYSQVYGDDENPNEFEDCLRDWAENKMKLQFRPVDSQNPFESKSDFVIIFELSRRYETDGNHRTKSSISAFGKVLRTPASMLGADGDTPGLIPFMDMPNVWLVDDYFLQFYGGFKNQAEVCNFLQDRHLRGIE